MTGFVRLMRGLLVPAIVVWALAFAASSAGASAPDWSVYLSPGQSARVPFVASDLHCSALNVTAYAQFAITGGWGWSYSGSWRAVWYRSNNTLTNVADYNAITCAAWRG